MKTLGPLASSLFLLTLLACSSADSGGAPNIVLIPAAGGAGGESNGGAGHIDAAGAGGEAGSDRGGAAGTGGTGTGGDVDHGGTSAGGVGAGGGEPGGSGDGGTAGSAGDGGSGGSGGDIGGSAGAAGASDACSVSGAAGECLLVADCAALGDHTSYPGHCAGPSDIQCCIETPSTSLNPPIPDGYVGMQQSQVTPDMTTWAVMILDDPATYPMFSTVMKTFGTLMVLARVEWHPPDFQNGVVHRGVTLYVPK